MITELKNDIYWIGFVDWNVRDFHGYETDKGSTYNAYLIKDEKTAIVDSVKAPYWETLVRNIKKYTKLEDVSYIICNHAEPDHSGSIPKLVELCPQAEVICNAKCKNFLSMYYDTADWNFKVIKEGESVSLGKRTVTFFDTPMAHWPESMMTYMPEEKLLFSMDAFGQHYATSGRFDEDAPLSEIVLEATKYYANIIMPLGRQVVKALEKASQYDIEMIAPSHGIIWKTEIPTIIELYKKWATYQVDKKVVVFYDSMWHSTEMMAHAIYEGAQSVPGVEVKLYDVKATHITELATQVIDCAAFAVGSPTLNMTLMPKVAEALTYIQGLGPQNKLALSFGSYGWAKKAGQHHIIDYLNKMKVTLLDEEPYQSQFKPTEENLEKGFEYGVKLAEYAKEQ